MEESEDDGLVVTVGQRDGFKPSSEAIHTGEEETVPSWWGKGTDQIDMHIVETCIGGVKGANRCNIVAMHLGGFSRDAAPRPIVLVHLRSREAPTKPCGINIASAGLPISVYSFSESNKVSL